MIILALIAFIVWAYFDPIARYLDRRDFARWLARWKREGCSYNDEGRREVVHSGDNWVLGEDYSGDIHVLPLGELEEHGTDSGCICGPRVDIEGAHLVIVHNSFDHREIVEEAINIMNGVDNAESG